MAALGRAVGGLARGARGCCSARHRLPRAPAVGGVAGARRGGRRWRPGGVRARHGGDPAQRRDPVGRTRAAAGGHAAARAGCAAAAARRRSRPRRARRPAAPRPARQRRTGTGGATARRGRRRRAASAACSAASTPGAGSPRCSRRTPAPTPGPPPPSAPTTPPATSSPPRLPVMAVGGFNGTDPAPTLAQFQQYVADGKIHYFIGGTAMAAAGLTDRRQRRRRRGSPPGCAGNFTATTVGGTTVYDLRRRLVTRPPSPGRMHSSHTGRPQGRDSAAAETVDMSTDAAEPAPAPSEPPGTPPSRPRVLDVVVPVYNEETDLEPSVRRLDAHLAAHFPYSTGSRSPTTPAPTPPRDRAGLAGEIAAVDAVRLEEKGRGRALRAVWGAIRRGRARLLRRRPLDRPTVDRGQRLLEPRSPRHR